MKTNNGFTLIEILVVVLIIGILAAVALPKYQYAVKKSQATQQVLLLKSARDALDLFYLGQGAEATPTRENLDITFPPDTDNLDVKILKNSDGVYAAIREKAGGGDDFVLRYFYVNNRFPQYSGKIVCSGQNSTGDKICQDIGGTGKHSYKHITSQNAWYLN